MLGQNLTIYDGRFWPCSHFGPVVILLKWERGCCLCWAIEFVLLQKFELHMKVRGMSVEATWFKSAFLHTYFSGYVLAPLALLD